MKTCAAPASMLLTCCFGLLVPLPMAAADEPPQGLLKFTVGVEGEGLEKIPLVGSLLRHFLAAAEKPCEEETPQDCPVCPRNDRGVPCGDRLFRNVGPAPARQACETAEVECPAPMAREVRFVGPDGLERIGIDFDFDVANCGQCQTTRCAPANSTRPVALCAPRAANCPAPVAVYPAQGGPYSAAACEVLPAPLAMLQSHQAQPYAGRDELIEALMDARIEAAIAQTSLKAREESDAKQFELIKELVSSQVENAKLTAKLELAAEKEKMLAEIYEARVQLTALQEVAARENEASQRKRRRKDTEARRPVEVEAIR